MTRLLFCEACNCKILTLSAEEFQYTEEGAGPFCETCWFFMRHIEALRARVTDLEKEVRKGKRRRTHGGPL